MRYHEKKTSNKVFLSKNILSKNLKENCMAKNIYFVCVSNDHYLPPLFNETQSVSVLLKSIIKNNQNITLLQY